MSLDVPLSTGAPVDDCWNRIGVAGDASCPELKEVIHCRNCRVFSSAARGFFERSAPEGYLADWTRLLSAPVEATGSDDVSLLIFRLNQEWLALSTRVVAEVTVSRPIHRIPHRTDDVLIGLVNLRGQLQLCVSLHGLVGADPPTASPRARPPTPPRGTAG